MSKTTARESELPSPLLAGGIDEVCDRFEAAWRVGQRPCVLDYCAGATEAERLLLLRYLVPLDVECRRRQGEEVTAEDYREALPHLDDAWLTEALHAPVAPPFEAPATSNATVNYPAPSTGLPASNAPAGRDFVPGYEVLAELGRGGMGVVYKARQTKLNRLVALKMILAGGHASDEERSRFLTEAEAVARLRHPNIVQIYEVGEHEGRPFFSLEFCAGGSLDAKLGGTPLLPHEAAQLVQTLARATDAAHQAHILHRDLKPANILLTPKAAREDSDAGLGSGLRLVDLEPKVADFGLARKLDEKRRTVTGAVLGTPSYVAPEQAEGKSGELGPACDTYALGAILYECLTGRPPFKGATALDTIRQVLADEPASVRQLQPSCPRDLETICQKCLHKDPGRRYGTALELAEDLQRFQEGLPVKARPLGSMERGWRWCRRNPVVAGLLAVVALVLLLGAGVATFFAVRADQEAGKARQAQQQAEKDAERATKQTKNAEEQLDRAEMAVYVNKIMLAQAEWEHGSPSLAWKHLQQCQKNLRGWEHRYLVTQFNKVPTFRGHKYAVASVAYSADSKRIVSGSWDKMVKVWDTEKGVEVLSLKGHTGQVSSVAYSPDGKRIVSGSYDKTLKVWDAVKGTEILSLKGHTDRVWSVAFSSDGKRIVSGSQDGTVKLWDADKGTEILALQGNSGFVSSVAFSPDGKRIVSASDYGPPVTVWDADKGVEILTLKGHTRSVSSVAFSPDGKRIVSGSKDETVKVWDADKGTEILTLRGHTRGVNSVSFSPDGKRIVSGSSDDTLTVWDAVRGTEILTLKGHTFNVSSVAFSPDGKRIVSGSWDDTLKVWDTDNGIETLSLEGHTRRVTSVAFSPDGRRIASAGGWDHTVKVWDADKGVETLSLKGTVLFVPEVLSFSPDGKRIASASRLDWTVKVWDADKGVEILSLKGHRSMVTSVSYSADGKRIVSGSWDNTVKVWDADKGVEIISLAGHTGKVTSVVFSPDGKRIASASDDKTVKVWDGDKGVEILSLKGHRSMVTSVSYSADGKRIVSGSWDNTVKVWDADKGVEIISLAGHTGKVTSVVFSPDGKRIASASADKTVKVWDADKGAEMLSLKGHTDWVTSVAFSPDGKSIASASNDQTVKVWDASKGDMD